MPKNRWNYDTCQCGKRKVREAKTCRTCCFPPLTDEERKRRAREASRKWYQENKSRKSRAWNLRNPDRVRANSKKWWEKNRESYVLKRRIYVLKSKYGLTLQEWEMMVLTQRNSCALCQKEFKNRRSINVDHCHKTGKVRGLLCTPCNRGIGVLGDDEEGLERALKYVLGELTTKEK